MARRGAGWKACTNEPLAAEADEQRKRDRSGRRRVCGTAARRGGWRAAAHSRTDPEPALPAPAPPAAAAIVNTVRRRRRRRRLNAGACAEIALRCRSTPTSAMRAAAMAGARAAARFSTSATSAAKVRQLTHGHCRPPPRLPRCHLASQVAFVGLGNMGGPMARNLLQGGHELVVFDLAPAAVASLTSAGAKAASTVKDAARDADAVITMLPNSPHVRSVRGQPPLPRAGMQPHALLTLPPLLVRLRRRTRAPSSPSRGRARC